MPQLSLSHLGIKDNIEPRYVKYTPIYDCEGDIIDNVIIIKFKAPNSFTGEDVIEIHTHGSLAVINIIIIRIKQDFQNGRAR